MELDEKGNGPVTKTQNRYMCVATPHFRFLDIAHYLGPGASYNSFMRAYTTLQKSYMAYEWMDDPEKLNYCGLP